MTSTQVEIYQKVIVSLFTQEVDTRAKFITDTHHYPPAQQAYAEENVQKLLEQATKVGPETEAMIKNLLSESHPLRHLRRIQGIIAL